ncbi:putative 149 kDa protein [Dissostichus eleginoides]|uniref:149 kDa protein n=1 Tax=Dissostichus eleginoides TaxID=100907 RepID=A0AAD9B2N7_DISEL|nr:putative 149 kDa protein [Dissostichus eleginoides]
MGDVGMFSREWTKGDSVWSVGGVHSTGVGILFCFKEIRVEDVFVIDQGRAIGADITWGTRKLRVIVVYGPQSPAERTNLFTSVEPFLVTNRQVIIGGDFNVELGKGGDASDQHISQLMVRCGLVDGGTVVKPHIDSPTWRNSRGMSKRLDYFFFSRSLNLSTGRTIPVFFSDHDGLLFRVDLDAQTFGPGYWRLNVSVLEERFFNQQFPLFFEGVLGLKPLCQGILEWWEVAKDRIKTFCLGYCKMKARRSKREVSHLQRLLEREYAKGNCGATINQNVCDALKTRLRHVAEGKARAFLARSRAFIEQSETCSAAFFSSVRAKKARQVVTGIRDSQGIVVTEDGQMVRVATDHFRDSFKEKEVGRGDDFLELLERQVPGDIVQALELPLTG